MSTKHEHKAQSNDKKTGLCCLPNSFLFAALFLQLTSLLSGSLSGLLAITATFPLDTVNARLAYHTPGARKYAGIWDTGWKVFGEEGGMRGLYRGFSAREAIHLMGCKVDCGQHAPQVSGTRDGKCLGKKPSRLI
jgi:hypothetical protein